MVQVGWEIMVGDPEILGQGWGGGGGGGGGGGCSPMLAGHCCCWY